MALTAHSHGLHCHCTAHAICTWATGSTMGSSCGDLPREREYSSRQDYNWVGTHLSGSRCIDCLLYSHSCLTVQGQATSVVLRCVIHSY